MSTTYTFAGDANVDALLEEALSQMADAIGQLPCAADIRGVFLGGGYGRGEGGVLREKNGTSKLYNDLDLFVIVRDGGDKDALNQAFAHLGEDWGRRLGIAVDFSRACTLAYVERHLHVMMWQELVRGHRCVYGDAHLFEGKAFRTLPKLALSEGMRLLMNRFAGMLWAAERLQKTNFLPEDADFVARNINKLRLACGEVVLMSVGQYAFETAARQDLLSKLDASAFPDGARLREQYAQAASFKKYPELTVDPAVLAIQWQAVCGLALAVYRQLYAKFNAASRPRGREWVLFPVRNVRWAGLLRASGGKPSLFKNPVLSFLEVLAEALANKDVLRNPPNKLLWNIWISFN